LFAAVIWILGLGRFDNPTVDFVWKILPLYILVSTGCYCLFVISIDLIKFNDCPTEGVLLAEEIHQARSVLQSMGFVFT